MNGPAAIYLVGAAGDVTRRATAGMSAALTDVLPFSVPPGHFAALTRALESGQRQTLPYAVNLPREERDALRESGARWLTVTPIRGRQGIVGAVVILWRQRTPGDMLSVIDLVAGHLGIALEHARAYRAAEDERTQLELILAQIPDAVLISDAAGRLERTNAAGSSGSDRTTRCRRSTRCPSASPGRTPKDVRRAATKASSPGRSAGRR